ncbi:MAG: DNA polymerase III subunit delta [Planctomycetota bacterium]
MAKKPASNKKLDACTRIAVLTGKDQFLKSQHVSALKDALRQAHGEIDVFQFDGDSTPAADVLDECRSFGLMSTHKLIVVDNAESLVVAETRPLIERYAEHPVESATLVLRPNRWYASNLDKAIDKIGAVIKCDQPTEDQATRWAQVRAQKRHDATLQPEAAHRLVARVGADLGKIDAELAKLAVAVGPGGTITMDHLGELATGTKELEPWSVQEALLAGNPDYALRRVRAILADAPKDLTVPAMIATVQLAQKLHGFSAGSASGANTGELAKIYKLWGPSKDAVLGTARRIRPDQARRAFLATVESQARTMSGLGKGPRTLEVAALRLAMLSRHR